MLDPLQTSRWLALLKAPELFAGENRSHRRANNASLFAGKMLFPSPILVPNNLWNYIFCYLGCWVPRLKCFFTNSASYYLKNCLHRSIKSFDTAQATNGSWWKEGKVFFITRFRTYKSNAKMAKSQTVRKGIIAFLFPNFSRIQPIERLRISRLP